MHLYLGIAFTAFTTLAIEITLVRLLSLITWYHLAFFAISTAMLGMTAGAVTVYVRRESFAGEKLERAVSPGLHRLRPRRAADAGGTQLDAAGF